MGDVGKLNNMEILESNKLIAEFMGMELTEKDRGEPTYKTEIKGEVIWVSQLQYHTSWDWLMPVVEKIETRDDMPLFIQHGNYAEFSYMVNHNWPDDREKIVCNDVFKTQSRIEAVYDCVVKLIQWHNKRLTSK